MSPNTDQTTARVLILRPFYVTGKLGVICDIETDECQRWIIKVDGDENIVVSLSAKEFQALSQDCDRIAYTLL